MRLFKHTRKNRRNPEPGENAMLYHHIGVTVLVGSVMGLAVYIVLTLLDPETLPLRKLDVRGELVKVEVAQVAQKIEDYLYDGFFKTKLDGIKREVESLPWVYDTSIRRVWPDTLRITVEEQVALARWGDSALVNEQGEIFTPLINSFPDGLPVFFGPDGDQVVITRSYKALRDILSNEDLTIVRLDMDERRAIRILLGNGVELMLGRMGRQKVLWRFVRAYRSLLAGKIDAIAKVDLRYSNGFAVHWKPGLDTATVKQEG